MYLIMLRSIIAVHVFIQRADLDFHRHRLGVQGREAIGFPNTYLLDGDLSDGSGLSNV